MLKGTGLMQFVCSVAKVKFFSMEVVDFKDY